MPRLLLKAEMQKLAQLQDADTEGRKQAHIGTVLSMVKRAAQARAWADRMQGGMEKEALVAEKVTKAVVGRAAKRGARAAATTTVETVAPKVRVRAPKLTSVPQVAPAPTTGTLQTPALPGNTPMQPPARRARAKKPAAVGQVTPPAAAPAQPAAPPAKVDLGPRPQLPAQPKMFQPGVVSSAQSPAVSGTITPPGSLKKPSYIERVSGGPQPTTLPSHAPGAVTPPTTPPAGPRVQQIMQGAEGPAGRMPSQVVPPPTPPQAYSQKAVQARQAGQAPQMIQPKPAQLQPPEPAGGRLAQAEEAGLQRPKAQSFKREMTPAQREEYIKGRRETRLTSGRGKLQELETKLKENPAGMTRQEHQRLAKLRANPELMDYHRTMQAQEAKTKSRKNLKWGLAAGIGLPVAALGYGAYKTVGALAPALGGAAANPMAPGGGWSPTDYGYGSNPYGPGALNLGPGM